MMRTLTSSFLIFSATLLFANVLAYDVHVVNEVTNTNINKVGFQGSAPHHQGSHHGKPVPPTITKLATGPQQYRPVSDGSSRIGSASSAQGGSLALGAPAPPATYIRCISSSGVASCNGASTSSASCPFGYRKSPRSPPSSWSLTDCQNYYGVVLCAFPCYTIPYYSPQCNSDLIGCPSNSVQAGDTYGGWTQSIAYYNNLCTSAETSATGLPDIYQWCYDYLSGPNPEQFGLCKSFAPPSSALCTKRTGNMVTSSLSCNPSAPTAWYACVAATPVVNAVGHKCRPINVGCDVSEVAFNLYYNPNGLFNCLTYPTGLKYELCFDPDSPQKNLPDCVVKLNSGSNCASPKISLSTLLGSASPSKYPNCGDLYSALYGKTYISCTASGFRRCRPYVSTETLRGCATGETYGSTYTSASSCYATQQIVCSGSSGTGNCFCGTVTSGTAVTCPNSLSGEYVAGHSPNTCASYCPPVRQNSAGQLSVVKCTVTCNTNGRTSTTSPRTIKSCIPLANCKLWSSIPGCTYNIGPTYTDLLYCQSTL